MSSKLFATLVVTAAVLLGGVSWGAEPIWRVLAVAVVAGLAWWLGMRSGVGRGRPASPPVVDARGEVQDLLQELARVSAMQCHSGGEELERARGLLKEAIDDLLDSFGQMNRHVRAQHDLALAMVTAQPGNPELGGVNLAQFALETSANLASLAENTVTALQFQDLLGQLIGHVQARMQALSVAVGEAAVTVAGAADLAQGVIDARQQLQSSARLEHTRFNPVGQMSMRPGGIELF